MTEEQKPVSSTPSKKGNKMGIIVALLLIIILIQSIKIYLDYQENVEVTEQLSTTEVELATTLQRLTEISAELDQKIIDIGKLGGDVTDLEKAKAEITAELKRSQTGFARTVKELKDRVEGYEELLKIKDEEIDKLQSVNKQLFSENRSLKTTQNKLSDSINNLTKNKEELADKVAIASQLKAENVKIVSVNAKGKEREGPFRSRQLETLKVDFNISENKVAPIEGKKIMIRVIDENRQVIFDVAKGSGTFILNGKEEFYTASQEILFDNSRQNLSFTYDKGTDYASGNYSIEIFTDGYLMGSQQFSVK